MELIYQLEQNKKYISSVQNKSPRRKKGLQNRLLQGAKEIRKGNLEFISYPGTRQSLNVESNFESNINKFSRELSEENESDVFLFPYPTQDRNTQPEKILSIQALNVTTKYSMN